ncbi:uncharacterized protein LOC129318415 [Prosopis cineraria]|uniref:uncharacterized protein LOC129318415 n=1 Tax=Prosopis cineraria TaxID=364024 RepID=UPI0024103ECC|nr:uncharacterized protein LOC129318415 [Prosopis cineraria]
MSPLHDKNEKVIEGIIVKCKEEDEQPRTKPNLTDQFTCREGKSEIRIHLPHQTKEEDKQPRTKPNLTDQFTCREGKSEIRIHLPHQTKVSSAKETHEHGSKRNVATNEAIMAIQSSDLESLKQFRASFMIAQGTKDTMKQGLEKNYAKDDVMTAVHLISNLLGKDSVQRNKEAVKDIVDNVSAINTSPETTPFDSEFIGALDTEEAKDSSVQEEHK